MNVRINASGIKDKAFTDALLSKADELEKQAEAKEAAIRTLVAEKMK
jgi:formiminotetrahydrofolate cyclodeaminase